MELIIASEFAATGSAEMSWFQTLEAGKIGQLGAPGTGASGRIRPREKARTPADCPTSPNTTSKATRDRACIGLSIRRLAAPVVLQGHGPAGACGYDRDMGRGCGHQHVH